MRVSTAQFYYQNSLLLTNKQSSVNEQIKYLSEGKRVLTAKDDAVAYGTLSGYKDEQKSIEKYQRNITQAQNRNTLQETSFSTAEGLMQQLKQSFVQANNGTLTDEDLKALADLSTNNLEEMLSVANSKDETGGYIFAGYQIDKEPFVLQADNSVKYFGDNGIRELQIGQNVMVDINQSGDDAFEKIKNPIGDFSATYNANSSGISVSRAVIVDPGAYDVTTSPPDYNFNFTSSTDLIVTDNNGATVFSTSSYISGQIVAFNGVEVQVSGNPLPGDDFDIKPQENISIFDSIKAAIDWMNQGATSSTPEQRQVDYEEISNQLNNALNQMTSRRTDAGVRMQLIENQENNLFDKELILASGSSRIEDLDFAKAISTFEQSQVALQAAQQSFVQVKNLSLFNYI